jgi:hypothetical protein
MKQHILTLCTACGRCPKIFIDNTRAKNKQVTIIDDFGNQVYLSKEQLVGLARKAKDGTLIRENV